MPEDRTQLVLSGNTFTLDSNGNVISMARKTEGSLQPSRKVIYVAEGFKEEYSAAHPDTEIVEMGPETRTHLTSYCYGALNPQRPTGELK
jgi:hypothetical protein